MNLHSLGWSAFFDAQVENTSLRPCRVVSAGIDHLLVHDGTREAFAVTRGRLRCHSNFPPTVGDWVLVNPTHDRYVVEKILERRTAIVRKQGGTYGSAQALAANIDRVLLVTSLNQDFSVRRLERYLTLIWDSGATPIVALTKVDLVADPGPFVRAAEKCSLGFPVVCVSSLSGQGLDELRSLLMPAETIVLLGSSGVGKSTLINVLSGTDLRKTKAIRELDGKGRHATSDRHLLQLPSGVLVIDTPGLREVQLWATEEAVDQTFPEISALGENCRFRDCRHKGEPGCAVLAAVADGKIDPDRLTSFHRLRRELEYLERQSDPLRATEQKRRIKQIMRAYEKQQRARKEI
jgi:ribosome biogenesis GTPase / thiamine phosphate phosphatase